MSEFDRELFVVTPPAFGLVVLGLLGLITPRIAFAWRVGLTGLLVAGVYGFLNAAFLNHAANEYPLIALLVTVSGVAAFRTRATHNFLRQFQRPAISGTALLVVGMSMLVVVRLRHDAKVEDDAQRNLDRITAGPLHDRVDVPEVHAVTDRGRPIPVSRCVGARSLAEIDALERQKYDSLNLGYRAIRRQPGGDDCNCHGWVFTGGRYIVANESVSAILEDNGYLRTATAAAGDLVIYRSSEGDIIHTAVVRYVAPGQPPMVEGKWGWMGVYLHAADATAYGKKFAFYRANRDGDVLRGIDGSAAPVRFTGAE